MPVSASQAGCASLAATSAACASSRVPSGTSANASPLAGLSTDRVCPLLDPRHSPPICIRYVFWDVSIAILIASVLPIKLPAPTSGEGLGVRAVLTGGQAEVDDEASARNKRRVVRREIERGRCDLLRRAQAAHRL